MTVQTTERAAHKIAAVPLRKADHSSSSDDLMVVGAFRSAARFLRPSNIMNKLGLINMVEEESMLRSKVCAVDAFMEGSNAHLTIDNNQRIENFIVAERLYTKAMEWAEKVGKIDEIKRRGYINWLDHHRQQVRLMLDHIDVKKIDEITDLIESPNGHHHKVVTLASKRFFKKQMRQVAEEAWGYAILGVGALALSITGLVGAVHYDKFPDLFYVAATLAGGGSGRAFLSAIGQWQRHTIFKNVYQERYTRDNGGMHIRN